MDRCLLLQARVARPPRLHPDVYRTPGAFLVTWCTHARRPLLVSHARVGLVVRHLNASAVIHAVDLVAYCCMPDHVHVLVQVGDAGGDLSEFIRRAKQTSAFEWKRARGETLWQSSWHDHALRNDQAMLECVAYLVANPVRAGLVERVEEYPYWDVSGYSRADVVDAVSRTHEALRRR